MAWDCLQSCSRKPEQQSGAPLLVAGVEGMGHLVSAMQREWEVATHNATMAALAKAQPPPASAAAVPNGAPASNPTAAEQSAAGRAAGMLGMFLVAFSVARSYGAHCPVDTV